MAEGDAAARRAGANEGHGARGRGGVRRRAPRADGGHDGGHAVRSEEILLLALLQALVTCNK